MAKPHLARIGVLSVLVMCVCFKILGVSSIVCVCVCVLCVVCGVFGGCLQDVWWVSSRCLVGVFKMFGGFGVFMIFGVFKILGPFR